MVNVMIQAKFRSICMESSVQTGAYIHPTICTNRLIFGKEAFFIFLFLNMLTNLIIIINLNFCDVTLPFSI